MSDDTLLLYKNAIYLFLCGGNVVVSVNDGCDQLTLH